MERIAIALVLLPIAAHAAPQTKDAPNGYDLYLKAAKLITSATPTVDPIDDPEIVSNPKERAERYSLRRRRAWLRKNAAGFALFQKALRTPVKHPTIALNSTDDPTFSTYATLRQLAREKGIERNTRQMMGDWNGAMQSRLDIVQMGTDVGRGGVLISGLVAVAIQAIGRDAPWTGTRKLNLAQTRAAIARLQTIHSRRLREADILKEEKRYGLVMLQKQLRKPNWRDILDWDNETTPTERLQMVTFSPATVRRNYTRMMDVYIANARTPLRAKKAPLPTETDPFTKVVAPVYERSSLNFARNDAGNAVWLCALALHAYALETGKFPSKLDELVPRYLKAIPADPFGAGEKLRYRRTAQSYLLWSIGPDGKDDGGKPIGHRRDRRVTPRNSARLPFIDFESKGDFVAGRNR